MQMNHERLERGGQLRRSRATRTATSIRVTSRSDGHRRRGHLRRRFQHTDWVALTPSGQRFDGSGWVGANLGGAPGCVANVLLFDY